MAAFKTWRVAVTSAMPAETAVQLAFEELWEAVGDLAAEIARVGCNAGQFDPETGPSAWCLEDEVTP